MTSIRGVKPHDWPPADQRAWGEACRPGGRLTRGGRASHLKPVTRLDLVRRYGLFLEYLCRTGGTLPDASASALVTPENVALYIADLKARVSSVSVHGGIAKLRRMAELLDPAFDSGWLREIEQELAWDMRPASKFHRIVDSDRITEAGERLMKRADDSPHLPPCHRAKLYRDGLMLALLAVCPIRLKNLAALRIGTTLRKIEDCWFITLAAADTKNKRADERKIPEYLTPAIERYLSVYRKPAHSNETALWIGYTGRSLGYSGVEKSITASAKSELGVALSPHLFRDSAASTLYRHAGHMPGLASAILQHTDPRVTERHYNRAKAASFAEEFGRIIELP
jgi:integrase